MGGEGGFEEIVTKGTLRGVLSVDDSVVADGLPFTEELDIESVWLSVGSGCTLIVGRSESIFVTGTSWILLGFLLVVSSFACGGGGDDIGSSLEFWSNIVLDGVCTGAGRIRLGTITLMEGEELF